ncbi:sensor histidine kinase [Leucobacter chromiireducens]|uniref:sensor histidine kinase n=1 Tax=Leucobacter chromiireducens TaxID=283877 RepID=UPI000F640917|nr:ATP-binding protein [Leucobacter chromiireducens]
MTALRSLLVPIGASDAAGLTPAAPGGATRSLLGSISRVALAAAAAWQAIMVAVTLYALGAAGIPLAVVQVLVAALALCGLRWPRLWSALSPAMVGTGVLGFLASGDLDSSLTFAVCWQINFSSCIAGLLVLRRSAIWVVLGAAMSASAAMLILLPEWGFQLPLSTVVTQTSIIVALRLGLSALLGHAAATDASMRDADDAALRSESLRRQSARLAENARVLHDTAINTFAAIAAAGAGTREAGQVRAQCARDAALLGELRGSRTARSAQLLDLFAQPGLPIRRHGADDGEIASAGAGLSPAVIDALVGCVREAVTNATKHSGADHIDIEVTTSDAEFCVSVRDDGVGFDGEATPGRGVAASIRQRAIDHGFTAAVRSGRGTGTSVALTVPRVATPAAAQAGATADAPTGASAAADPELTASAATVQRRAGDYWAVGATVVSVVLAATGGTNEGAALFPMIGVMLAAVGLSRVPALRRGHVVLPLLLLVGTLVVFALGARATAYGTVGANHWQALAPTAPFVLFLSTGRGRGWRVATAVAWGGLVLGLAASVLPRSATAAVIVLVAGVVGLGFSGVWILFQGFVRRLSETEAAARRATFAARLGSELELGSQESFRRWIESGLDSAESLLRGIRDGELAVADPATRAACDEEERYLRQLVQIPPSLVHLGAVIMPTLSRARALGIPFRLRLGDRDAADERVARDIGAAVTENLTAERAGRPLTATLFPTEDGLQLTLTGQALRAPAHLVERASLVRLGDTELLEIDFGPADSLTSAAVRPPGRDTQ